MCKNFPNCIISADTLLSFVAIVCSVIALWQTYNQIKLSNRQHLFDRRLSAYLTILDLYESYRTQNEKYVLKEDCEFVFGIGAIWYSLVGNLYLESIQKASDYPIESQQGKAFSIKMAEFNKMAEEINLLFPKRISTPLSAFILVYMQTVRAIYHYLLVWNSANQDPVLKTLSLQQKLKEIGEPHYRKEVNDALKKLDATYQIILKKNLVFKVKKYFRL